MNATIKIAMKLKKFQYGPAFLMKINGTFKIPASNVNGKTKLLVKLKVACSLTRTGIFHFQTIGKSFLLVSIAPFVQRNGCAFNAFISAGNSAGVVKSRR